MMLQTILRRWGMFHRKGAVLAFLFLISIALMVPTVAGATGNVNVFIGSKTLDKDDWAPVEDQGEFGVQFDISDQDWPVSIAVNFLTSTDDSGDDPLGLFSDYSADTQELQIGVKKIWDVGGRAHPFVGGGAALIRGSYSGPVIYAPYFTSEVSDSDSGLGAWATAGVFWTFGSRKGFNIGVEATWSKADLEILGADVDGGGLHLGLIMGFHW